jgi:hypothetical protein
VKDGSIKTAVKQYLYPYLPARLQKDELIPPIVYTYYLKLEANGAVDMILQDAYLSYLIDGYAKRLKINQSNAEDPQAILFSTVSGISQEGIADLIDKEVLYRTGSPVYDYMKDQTKAEDQKTGNYLLKLNEELIKSSVNGTLHNPAEFGRAVTGDAGHLPDRFMGKAIK